MIDHSILPHSGTSGIILVTLVESGQPALATRLFKRRLIFNANEERSWCLNALSPQNKHIEVKVSRVDTRVSNGGDKCQLGLV